MMMVMMVMMRASVPCMRSMQGPLVHFLPVQSIRLHGLVACHCQTYCTWVNLGSGGNSRRLHFIATPSAKPQS
jgi:hypothetical protein